LGQNRNISINCNSDVNFLIGVNGSGKTTVINMIAAVLSADLPTLDRLPFRTLKLQLCEVDGQKKPSIEVEKKPHENSPYPGIIFRIRDKASEKPSIYSLNELEEERSYESSVDQKVSELSNEFVKYFSLLEKQSTSETEKFQEIIFLSLLMDRGEKKIFESTKSLNIKDEKNSIIDIFKLLHLDENIFSTRVEKHFKAFDSALKTWQARENITLDDLAAVIGTWRIHSVVQKYNILIDKRKKIFESKDTFLDIVNRLMQPKKLLITDKNELLVNTQLGNVLPLTRLSSGEKQLLIILGEGLLQEKKPWIYIADEPELSLHIKWQETLIHNLRSINPAAQIIFATHSPDIVSNYGDRVFDMEKIVV
jgi:energy-coupling factor transporter ATP-binding protein EcfA2